MIFSCLQGVIVGRCSGLPSRRARPKVGSCFSVLAMSSDYLLLLRPPWEMQNDQLQDCKTNGCGAIGAAQISPSSVSLALFGMHRGIEPRLPRSTRMRVWDLPCHGNWLELQATVWHWRAVWEGPLASLVWHPLQTLVHWIKYAIALLVLEGNKRPVPLQELTFSIRTQRKAETNDQKVCMSLALWWSRKF